MELIVLGSGGAAKFPTPTCQCEGCQKARKKGIPYARTGPALFVFPNILFETPEEISDQINRENIKEVKHVFYTHWHPDHTQGMRVLQYITFRSYDDKGIREEPKEPIKVYIPEDALKDFEENIPRLFYLEKKGCIEIIKTKDREEIGLGDVSVTPLNLGREDRIRYAFLVKEKNKRVVYAPCSIFQIKLDSFYENLDLLFLETGWFGDTKEVRKKGYIWADHISFEECMELIQKLKPKKAIFTHMNAMGIGGKKHAVYDELKERTKTFKNIDVAYDGMRIEL